MPRRNFQRRCRPSRKLLHRIKRQRLDRRRELFRFRLRSTLPSTLTPLALTCSQALRLRVSIRHSQSLPCHGVTATDEAQSPLPVLSPRGARRCHRRARSSPFSCEHPVDLFEGIGGLTDPPLVLLVKVREQIQSFRDSRGGGLYCGNEVPCPIRPLDRPGFHLEIENLRRVILRRLILYFHIERSAGLRSIGQQGGNRVKLPNSGNSKFGDPKQSGDRRR